MIKITTNNCAVVLNFCPHMGGPSKIDIMGMSVRGAKDTGECRHSLYHPVVLLTVALASRWRQRP